MTPQDLVDSLLEPYTAVAMDPDGWWWMFEHTPGRDNTGWGNSEGLQTELPDMLSVDYDGKWKDSLVTKVVPMDPVELVLHMIGGYKETYLPQSMMDAVTTAKAFYKEAK